MAYILKNNIRPGGSYLSNLKNGSTEIKFVSRGDGKIFYDIQYYLDYDSPSISFSYPNTTTAASGGSMSPSTKSFSQSWNRVGYSGIYYEQSSISTGATITYQVVSGTGATVDSSGKVTWESRGTDEDDNTRQATIRMTVTINGKTNYKDATVKQAANPITNITYGIPTGKSITVNMIPATGGSISSGTVTGTVKQLVTYTYASGDPESFYIEPSISSSYYSTAVTASNLHTTLKAQTKVGTLTYSYTCNGKTGSCSADVYQAANVVTSVSVGSNVFYYDDIGAGATSATPTSSHSPLFKYTTNETTSTIPSSTYGSLQTEVYYRILNTTTNGFTACNSSTGVLTATSRGTDYGSSTRRSAEVVKTLIYTWTPVSSTYGLEVGSGEITEGAYCTQAKNLIKSLTLRSLNAGSLTNPDTYSANANTKTVSNNTEASCGCRVTFDSESYSDSYSTWVNLTKEYSWTSSNSYATLTSSNTSSLSVTMTSRGSVYDVNTRSATITRKVKFTASLKSGYTNASSVSDSSKSCTATVTQAKNVITSVEVTANSGSISHSAGTVAASGGTVSVTSSSSGSASAKLVFSSTSKIDSSSTYGSWSTEYDWSESDSENMIRFTNTDSTTMSVTVDSRGTNHSNSTRSATITRTYYATFTLNSNYNNGTSYGSDSDSTTALTITQAANTLSIKSITVSAGSLTSPSTYTAGTQTQSVASKTNASASGVLAFASGEEVSASSTYGTWSGPTYSWSSNQTYATLTSSNAASLNVTMTGRGSTIGNSRSATITRTVSYTYQLKSPYGTSSKQDSKSCTAPCTQEGNYVKEIISITASNTAYTHTYYSNTAAASGGTTSIVTNATCRYKFTSGSEANYSGSTTPSGVSWTWVRTYANNGTPNADATLNTSSGDVVWLNNKSTSTRSTSVKVTLTVTVTHSSTYSAGGTVTGTSEIFIDSKQTAGSKQYGNWTVSISANQYSTSSSPCPAGGGEATITSSATRPWTWNGVAGSGNTETQTPTLTSAGTSGSSLSNSKVSWGNNKTTSARSVKITATYSGVSNSVTIYQAAGQKNWSNWSVSVSAGTNPVAAGGGTSIITRSAIRYYKWNGTASSSTNDGNEPGTPTLSIPSGSAATLSGTTLSFGNNTTEQVRSVVVTATYSGVTATVTVNQSKGVPKYIINDLRVEFEAKGGSKNYTPIYTTQWNGVTTSSNTTLTGYSVAYSSGSKRFTVTAGSVTVDKNTDTTSTYTGYYTISKSGFTSGTLTCWIDNDEATTITYKAPVVTLTVGKIPASGGTISSGTVTYYQPRVQNYASGNTSNLTNLTSGGTVKYSAAVSADSLGTNIKNETKVGTLTATVTMNGIQGSKTVDVYQEANYVTGIESYVTAFSYTSSAPASGGDLTPTTGGRCNLSFTSGGSLTQVTTATSISGGSVSFSKEFTIATNSGTGATLKSTSTGVVNFPSRTYKLGDAWNTTVTYWITYTFTHNAAYNNGKALSDKSDASYAYPSQQANKVKSVSVTSYPGSITGTTVEHSGGSVDLAATGAWARATLTCTTDYTIPTDYPSTTYGQWQFSSYSSSSSDNSIATTSSSVYYNKVPITVKANTSTSERSVIITRKENGFTFTYGGTPYTSTATECSCTVKQKGNPLIKEEIKISSLGYSFAFKGNSSSIGHVSYPQHGSITYTKTYSDGSTNKSTLSYSNCTNSYRLASSTHFMYYSGSPGALQVTSNNNSGSVRSTTAYWTATYNNTELGTPITDTASCTVTQDFNRYYINIYNGSTESRYVYICRYTASNPSSLDQIYVGSRSTTSYETTWGLTTSDGYTLTTSSTVYVYVKDGNSLRSVGSISFQMNKTFEFSLDT